ncbi:MAG: hypothetical protein GX842_05315 [Spirochaetales bacterium]|jgi:hypothetical protein|nr:hypothetical protein [Spirochaetales bacterium]
MPIKEIKRRALQRQEEEIGRVEKELERLRKRHEELKQSLFDTSKRLQGSPDSSLLVEETEELKREIAAIVVEIRENDIRLSRLKKKVKK